MDSRPRVICGFPGVGKTTLFNKLRHSGILIHDSDSSQFNKDQFPENYIAHIQACLAAGAWVLCSTHTVVREALAKAGISYAIAAPAHKYLKDEYMARYRERGSPEGFLKLMDAKWDEFMDDVWVNDKHGMHIGLSEGEYLELIAKDILKSDEGMRFKVFHNPLNSKEALRVGQPYFTTEMLNGFQAGLIWAELLEAKAQGWINPAQSAQYSVRADAHRIYTDIAAALSLDLDVKVSMNPQAIDLTFRPRLKVPA
jgi:hypothetical protein